MKVEILLEVPGVFAAQTAADGSIIQKSKSWQDDFPTSSIQDVIARPAWHDWPEGSTSITALDNEGNSHAWVGLRKDDWIIATSSVTGVQSGKLAGLAQQIDDLRREAITQKDLAFRANDDLRAMAFGLSHDLNAPIRHAMKLLEKGSAALQYLAEAQEIIARLVEYGKAGVVEPQVHSFSLDELAEEIASRLPEAGIEWQNLGNVSADQDMLLSVLTNLVQNSIKYGKPPIRIIREAGALIVEDQGGGVSDEQADSMFAMFQRHSAGVGYGIGLALCRKIMDKLEGTIEAETSPTNFRILLRWPGLARE